MTARKTIPTCMKPARMGDIALILLSKTRASGRLRVHVPPGHPQQRNRRADRLPRLREGERAGAGAAPSTTSCDMSVRVLIGRPDIRLCMRTFHFFVDPSNFLAAR